MKNKETLEEVAETFLPNSEIEHDTDFIIGFITGAKWQQKRMYSEEDMKQAFFDGIRVTSQGYNGEYANGENPKIEEQFNKDYKEWFEKFKNK